MKIHRAFVGGLLLMLCSIAAAAAQTIQRDYDRSFNLARLRSYEFYPQERKPGDALAVSPLNDRRIHDALDIQLRAQGFVGSYGGQLDFLIAYSLTTRQGLDIRDNRFGVLRRIGSINVSQVTDGTLVVVFVDRLTRQEVWRGFMSGTIGPEPPG